MLDLDGKGMEGKGRERVYVKPYLDGLGGRVVCVVHGLRLGEGRALKVLGEEKRCRE